LQGENARLSSFVGAIAVADLVKTTLGPAGLDKILQKVGDPHDQGISVTNDGATILRAVPIDNAAAKVLVEISRVQDEQVGDGTTSVVVLAGELLREAEDLVSQQRIHPQTICHGYRMATAAARLALEEASITIRSGNDGSSKDGSTDIDESSSKEALRQCLLEIASTTLSSKLLSYEKDHFAQLAVNAVMRLGNLSSSVDKNNLAHIQVLKKAGGSLRDSYLEDGFLLDKVPGTGQPRRVEKAKILLANTSMDTDKIKIYGSRVKVDSLDTVAAIEQAEREKMRTKVHKILNHDGMNCFINRQLIYNFPESIFAEHKIMAIEHADFDGMDRLAAVLGGQVVSTFDHPEKVVLGECDLIEQVLIGEDNVMRFSGCKAGEACSIVLRGSSSHVLDEAERSLHDALAILTATLQDSSVSKNFNISEEINADGTYTEDEKNDDSTPNNTTIAARTVYGGGCAEMIMAAAVDRAAALTPGKPALAMTAFAKALRSLPTTVADNGGYDAAELVAQLRAAHANGGGGGSDTYSTAGLDMTRGTVGDMKVLGVRESFQSKLQVLLSASEAAEMILRVDDIIKAAPRRREEYGY
jgi:T-complex protein 1 subunit beta